MTEIGLKFIYNNLDPLIHKHFGICAIEYNEDYSVGYDYVVQALINHELRFSLPKRFYVGEFNLSEAVKKTSKAYRRTFGDKLVELSGENREIF